LYEDHFASQSSTLSILNSQMPNIAPVSVGLVLTYTLGFWAISARRWFAESIKQIAGEEKFNWFYYGLVLGVTR
jgi:hypothetical protein